MTPLNIESSRTTSNRIPSFPSQRPEWVPLWAWQEAEVFHRLRKVYASNILKAEKSEHSFSDLDIEYMHLRILDDKECSVVWEMMSRRATTPISEHRSEVELINGRCFSLLAGLTISLHGPIASQTISSSERKFRGERISKLAAQLRAEITALLEIGGPDLLTSAMFTSLQSVASFSSDEMIDKYLKMKLDSANIPSEYQIVIGHIVNGVCKPDDDGALAHLVAKATEWSSTKPSIYRPTEAGALRKHFVMSLTRHFRSHFHTPMRAQTAAITSCVFQIPIDESTVSKLAP